MPNEMIELLTPYSSDGRKVFDADEENVVYSYFVFKIKLCLTWKFLA
jgi:hypothetical protein